MTTSPTDDRAASLAALNPPTNPAIRVITGDDIDDPHRVEENLDRGARRVAETVPAHYADAVVNVPEVAGWVTALIDEALAMRSVVPQVRIGPSLLIVGPTGSGKTYQAYGALRALAASGVNCAWQVTTVADLYAHLRPRQGVDPEREFTRYADAGLLVLDDLGAAKGTEWTEEVNYRLVNHRYENHLPTLITSNVRPSELGAALGDRVASRLAEMCTRVVLRGPDRRTTTLTPVRAAGGRS